jgi:thymidylate synthase
MDKRHPEYQYLDLMRELLKFGVRQEDKGTDAVTYSLFGRQIRFDLAEGFPLLTTKKVYWKGVLYELFWFLSGQSNVRFLAENNVHIWDDYPYKMYREKMEAGRVPSLSKEEFVARIVSDEAFAREHGELRHIYGEMWRRWPAKDGRMVDQVRWVVNELIGDPDAHNTLVTSWNPEYLYAMAKPDEAARFPICHNMYQCNVKNGRLSLHLYQRSADIFLGVPFNIASYALLTHILARATGNEPGEFIHTFGDVHVYENHRDQAKEQLGRDPRPFPQLSIDARVKDIDDFRPEHATLTGYDPHPPIKAELKVAGGLRSKNWETYLRAKQEEERRQNAEA